jgi:hypothetical protein
MYTQHLMKKPLTVEHNMHIRVVGIQIQVIPVYLFSKAISRRMPYPVSNILMFVVPVSVPVYFQCSTVSFAPVTYTCILKVVPVKYRVLVPDS